MKNKKYSVNTLWFSWRMPLIISFCLLLFTNSLSAHSGADVINGVLVKRINDDEVESYYIYPKADTNSVLSHIRVNNFDTNSGTLYIVNNPILNADLVSRPELIVIENIGLEPMVVNEVKILGPRSDLLFVSKSGVICNACRFENSKRVTLAAGNLLIDKEKINIENNGTVTIVEYLEAQDVDSIDILAEKLIQNGSIMTLSKVTKSINGDFQFEGGNVLSFEKKEGEFIASQTRVNVNVGPNNINYHTLDSTFNGDNAHPLPLDLDMPIYAGSLYVNALGTVNISSTLSTKSDVMILNESSNNILSPLGGISISTFGDIKITSTNLSSSTYISMKGRNIDITPDESFEDVSLDADKVTLVAAETIINHGLITTNQAHITSKKFLNKGGELFVREDVFVQTDELIKNSDQGMLVGNNIYLDASVMVQNGQITPWYCSNRVGARDVGNNHIYEDSVDLGLGAGTITSSEFQSCPEKYRNYWSQKQREALIFGFNVVIKAPNVMNTNPKIIRFADYDHYVRSLDSKVKPPQRSYDFSSTPSSYSKMFGSELLPNPQSKFELGNFNVQSVSNVLRDEDSYSVMISAENTLQIDAPIAVKNGSASIDVLNGNFDVKTPNFETQRYYIAGRTYSYFKPGVWEQPKPMSSTCKIWEDRTKRRSKGYSLASHKAHLNDPNNRRRLSRYKTTRALERHCYMYMKPDNYTVEVKENWLAANSAVPRILVGKNFNIHGDRFKNLAGTVEVAGSMSGVLSSFENLGFAFSRLEAGVSQYNHSRRYCSKRVARICVRRKTKRWTTTSQQLLAIESKTGQLPAFFYLGSGELNVTGSKLPGVDGEGVVSASNITYGRF